MVLTINDLMRIQEFPDVVSKSRKRRGRLRKAERLISSREVGGSYIGDRRTDVE